MNSKIFKCTLVKKSKSKHASNLLKCNSMIFPIKQSDSEKLDLIVTTPSDEGNGLYLKKKKKMQHKLLAQNQYVNKSVVSFT